MVKNEVVLPAKLASKEAGAGLPPVIPEGMRAVSVRVNEVIGVAGYVLPGTRVDVLATASPTDAHADMTTKVILSNVQVRDRRHADRAGPGKGQADAGDRRHAARVSRSRPSASRWRAPKARFSSRCATRSTQGAPETPGIKTGDAARARQGPAPAKVVAGGKKVGGPGDAADDGAGAADGRNHPRRQALRGSHP